MPPAPNNHHSVNDRGQQKAQNQHNEVIHLFKWNNGERGPPGMFLFASKFQKIMKGIHVLCVNMWGVWWDGMIPHFTPFKSTYLYYLMRYSRILSLNSLRASVLPVIHFIITENPPGIWVYIITSKLCTSDCCCHYDCAKNPIISDTSDVCCNRKSGDILLWIQPPTLDAAVITCASVIVGYITD